MSKGSIFLTFCINFYRNVREVDYQTSKFALRILLRSWNGIAFFSRVGNNELHALVESLFIEQLEVRVSCKFFMLACIYHIHVDLIMATFNF